MIDTTHSELTAEEILSQLDGVRQVKPQEWLARCPAHDDHNPSLSVTQAPERVLLYCHAGCSYEAILDALGIDRSRQPVRKPPSRRRRSAPVLARYDYLDENGALLFQVERKADKDFPARRPNGDGGWVNNIQGVRRVIYNLPAVLACDGEPIWIVEGEQDADRLNAMGLVATCNPGGAGKWRSEFASYFQDKETVLLPDNDDVGRQHMQQVAENLRPMAAKVTTLCLPGLPHKGDVSDWLDQGHTLDDSVNLLADQWAADKGDGNGLERVDFAAILADGIPKKPHLIEGWLPEKGLGTLFGTGGVGKSTLLAHLAYGLVTGRDFCGLPVTRACKVLIVDEDQDHETSVRLYSRAWPDGPPPADRFALYCGQSIRLHNPKRLALLERELEEFRPELLICDTWQALTSGINDDNNSEVGEVLDRVIELRNRYGCAVLFTDHRRKSREAVPGAALSDELRGASVKRDKPDFLWLARRAEGENVLQLLQAKNRHGPLSSLQIRYSEEWLDGEDEPRAVLTGEGEVIEQARLADRIEHLIAAYVKEHPEAFAPKDIKALAEQELGHEIHSKPLHAAIRAATQDRIIEKRSHGKYQGKVSG